MGKSFMILGRWLVSGALAALATSPTVGFAATVTYDGKDNATQAAWRDPAVAKTLDQGEDNIYGTDGYVLFEWGRANWSWSARNAANDLSNLPPYISSVTDSFQNGYRSDGVYGQMNNPAAFGTNHMGTMATYDGWLWDPVPVVVHRNGNTGAFRLTVFTTHYDAAAPSPIQVWVNSGGANVGGAELDYTSGGTNYMVFTVGAGTENVDIRIYGQYARISGLAFDGLQAQPAPDTSMGSYTHLSCDTVGGAVHYSAGGVTMSAPAASTEQVYPSRSASAKITFNTGASGATYGAVQLWPTWKSIPINMNAFGFASYAPAGTVFGVGLEDNQTWSQHATRKFTQATGGVWQWNSATLSSLTAAGPIDPKNFTKNIGTIYFYIYGQAQGGPTGLAGDIYLNQFQFDTSNTQTPVTVSSMTAD